VNLTLTAGLCFNFLFICYFIYLSSARAFVWFINPHHRLLFCSSIRRSGGKTTPQTNKNSERGENRFGSTTAHCFPEYQRIREMPEEEPPQKPMEEEEDDDQEQDQDQDHEQDQHEQDQQPQLAQGEIPGQQLPEQPNPDVQPQQPAESVVVTELSAEEVYRFRKLNEATKYHI